MKKEGFKNIVAIVKIHWKLILICLVLGSVLSSIFGGSTKSKNTNTNIQQSERSIKYWTCSMHPQIKLLKEGQCPICGMDLISVYEGGDNADSGGPVSLILNEEARQLAEVETTQVEYREVSNEVRLVGKVDYDETRLSYISAWVPGRIDRLFVDFTGTRVRKGDHLIELYSPELIAAQQEYIEAVKNLEETKDSSLGIIRQTSKSTIESVKEKLRLFGIDEKQIEEIIQRGTPQEHMTIRSSVTGTVIQKNGVEGSYVKTGDKIYTIADLSKVWLYLDAYESDIQWLHYGQQVEIESEGYPGEMFKGKIAFIEPFVNEKTHTIKVRVNVDNQGEKLKPGMFVRTTIHAVLGEEGRIYEEDLVGKWICPMHPDVIKDQQEPCDICGMDLVKTSEFGFSEKKSQQKQALTIPKTAPLITGKRAVVYVENINDETGVYRYEGREVVLGRRAGDYYIVISGVKEGEQVVSKGNFKIDSALQIQAKPSMMNSAGYYKEDEPTISYGVSDAKGDAGVLIDVIPYYLKISKALAADDGALASHSFLAFQSAVIQFLESNQDAGKDKVLINKIQSLVDKMQHVKHLGTDIAALRKVFDEVSIVLKDVFTNYAYQEDLKLYLGFCPMAFNNKGAFWIQDSKEIKNPYYGAKMLTCGEVQAEYGQEHIPMKPMTGHEQHQ